MVASSHNLQVLRLVYDHEDLSSNVSFDGLVSHSIAKHFVALRILDLGSAFVGGDALEQLCTICEKLEELTVGVEDHTLVSNIILAFLPLRMKFMI